MRVKFPDDHFCETLRGIEVPNPSHVRKALARRCAYLIRKIQEKVVVTGDRVSDDYLLDELAATVVAVEAFEEKQRARRDKQ